MSKWGVLVVVDGREFISGVGAQAGMMVPRTAANEAAYMAHRAKSAQEGSTPAPEARRVLVNWTGMPQSWQGVLVNPDDWIATNPKGSEPGR